MSTKKVFVPVVELLRANASATVADILPQVEELTNARPGGGGSRANTYLIVNGETEAVFCYYHKQWFSPRDTQFGVKKTSPTGLNNFTTHGQNQWNKQRSEYEKMRADALNSFGAGAIDADELKSVMADAEEVKAKIIAHPDGTGFDTLADLVAHFGIDVDDDTIAAIDTARAAALASGSDE